MDRLPALDGVRGIAALVVLLHHLTLLNPARSALFAPGAAPPEVGSALWWLTCTPLVLAVIGGEAVFVFFVLSGLVVTRSALRADFDWLAYYPSRVLRLMLPVVAAVLLAVVVILLIPQDPARAPSGWAADAMTPTLDLPAVVTTVDVLFGEPVLDNPLWTLRWELLFSLLLPLYVVVAVALRRRWLLGCMIAVALLVLSWVVPNPALRFLPMFLLGAFLAVGLPTLREPASRSTRHGLWALGLLVALLALAARWLLWPVTAGTPFTTSVPGVISIVGAAALVLIAVLWSPLERRLGRAPFRWLGRISFSLYLTHVPIIIGVVALVPELPWWAQAAIGGVAALVVGELFARFAELPLHQLAKRIGGWARRTVDRRQGPEEIRDDRQRLYDT